MAEIDSLEIRIQAQATKANDAIDKLDDKLERLERALSSLNKVNIANFANGVDKLSKAMVSMNQVKTTDFTRLAKNLANLSTVNVAGLNSSASAVIMLSKAFGQLSTATQNANNIAIFANALSKLGNKGVQNAIANIPNLSNALQTLFASLANTPQISQNIIDMTNALANLASQGSKVGSASNSIVGGLNKTHNVMARTEKRARSLASAFGKFYASYFLIIRGVKNLWSAIEGSMDYVETYNYFNVALNKIGEDTASMFGEYGKDSAERYAEEFGNRLNELNEKMTGYIVGKDGALQLAGDMGLGLNIQQLMNFQAKVLSVTNSVGLMGEASTSAAKAVSMLAGDYSSLTNLPVEEVMEKLTSGMLGQSRALYSLGIDITNNTLQQYAYAEGIEKAVSEMTQSEKMQLRLLAILDQSEVAWGDLANTVDSVANQYRVFQMQIKNLGRTFGNLFLPIITNVLPYVNGLVIALNNLFTSLGFSVYGDTWLSDLQDGISGSVQGDVGELEEGLEDADDAAKKLKKSLSSFDELEVLSLSGVSSAQDAEGVINLTDSIAKALEEYEKRWNEAFENAENRASEFAEVITEKLSPIKEIFANVFAGEFEIASENISQLVADITLALNKAIVLVDWELVGENIGRFVSAIDWAIIGDAVAELLFGAIDAALTLWKGSFDIAPVETAIVTALGTIAFANLKFPLLFNAATTAIETALSGVISIKSLAISVGAFGITSPVGLELGNLILTQFEDWVAKNFGKGFVDAIGAVLTLTAFTLAGSLWGPIGAIVGAIGGGILTIFATDENARNLAKGVVEWLGKGIQLATSKLFNFDKTKIFAKATLESFQLAFKANSFGEIGKNILLGIANGFGTAFNALTEPIQDFFETLWSGISKAFGISGNNPASKMKSLGTSIIDGISQGFVAGFDALEETFKSLWNSIADWINQRLEWEIEPIKMFGKTLFEGATINLGELPKFYYNGGFPNSADLFYANENGVPELVGTMGRKTAVASGTEITGITDAIYSSHAEEMSIMRRQNEILTGILQKEFGISRDAIFSSVIASERENFRTSGESVFVH